MIPVFNLTRQYQTIRSEINDAVRKVLTKGYFTLGSEVVAFEQEFASYIGTGSAVGVGSGTDALTLVLKAYGLTTGDEVILPANSYPSAFGVALAGVTVRLADVGTDGCMDPESLRNKITKRTRAVIPVHMYGNPADIPGIRKVTGRKTLVIEDAAQAHGSQIGKKKIGSFGDAAIFSFYPSKNLGAYGDGGLITTDSARLAKTLRMYRQYGEKSRYRSEIVSGVSRLDELQAAVLRVKLRYLDEWNRRRREIAKYYTKELTGIGDVTVVTNIQFPISNFQKVPDTVSACHLFVIRTKKRDKLKEYLGKKGIGTGIHYPVPIHLTKSFRFLGYRKGDFPESEAAAAEALSLPLYPELTDAEAGKVTAAVSAFYKK